MTSLRAVKLLHTAVWAFFVACILAIPVFTAVSRFDFAALFVAVVGLSSLLVALTAFALCSLVFVPIALLRDPGGPAALLRRPLALFWINATTALAWLSYFFALRTIEPALVQVLFYGIGPLSVGWVDGLVPGSIRTRLSLSERGLHLGLLASLVVAAGVVLAGLSGLGSQPARQSVSGLTS